MVTYNRFINGSRDSGFFDSESMDFQERILHKSGLSEETFFPPGAQQGLQRRRESGVEALHQQWCLQG